MGQYHLIVNLTKREFLDPYEFGHGAKLWEQLSYGSPGGPADALMILLAVSNGRGGGDFDFAHPLADEYIGRWGGDEIAIVGNYADDNDLEERHLASSIYSRCISAGDSPPADHEADASWWFTDVSPALREIMQVAFEVAYWPSSVASGCYTRSSLEKLVKDFRGCHEVGDSTVTMFNGNRWTYWTVVVGPEEILGHQKPAIKHYLLSDVVPALSKALHRWETAYYAQQRKLHLREPHVFPKFDLARLKIKELRVRELMTPQKRTALEAKAAKRARAETLKQNRLRSGTLSRP